MLHVEVDRPTRPRPVEELCLDGSIPVVVTRPDGNRLRCSGSPQWSFLARLDACALLSHHGMKHKGCPLSSRGAGSAARYEAKPAAIALLEPRQPPPSF